MIGISDYQGVDIRTSDYQVEIIIPGTLISDILHPDFLIF
jgi:hypothetical protein